MKISLITVTYNSAQTLARAMRSVCRQTYSDIEYIVIDGESADTTMSIVREYAEQYPHIRYISEPDNGIYDAINKGIAMATGEVIGLVNSDDMLADNCTIEHIAHKMEETNADILYGDLLYCKYDKLEHNPPRVIRYWKSNSFRPQDLKLGWMPAHPTLYCKKSVFENLGTYRTDFRISADYEFILRAFSDSKFNKVYLPEILVKMEVGGISNRRIARKIMEDFKALQSNGYSPVWVWFCKSVRKLNQFFTR